MKYTEKDMLKLIEEVEKDFQPLLAKAELSAGTELAKAEDKEDKDKDKEEKPEVEAKDGKPAEDKPADKEDEKEDDKKDDDEDLDYDSEDFEMMKSMYGGMSKAELTAHHVTVAKAMEEKGFMNKSEQAVETLQKSETIEKVENKELDMAKSENELLKKENEELKKNVEQINKFLEILNKKSAPKAKAITSLDYIKKSEDSERELTKTEIHSILLTKSQDPKLSLVDREAINNYYNTKGSIDTIKHLLK